MTLTLSLTDVTHEFAENRALFRPLTLSFRGGTSYALTGPSGSGKSTLLSILAGWVKPAYGQVDRSQIDTVAWVFQNPHGVPRRDAIDHVVLPLLARGMTRAKAVTRAREILDVFGLGGVAEREFRALSGGEAQRLMLARSFAQSPSLLLVDEPTAQLDSRTAESVNTALGRAAGGGSIVVVATHDERTRDSCDERIDLQL